MVFTYFQSISSNLFSNETTYFLNNNNIDSTNCLFSGKNRRLSVILIGCNKFNGYLLIQNKIYSINPDTSQSYRVQLLKQHSSKCHFKTTSNRRKEFDANHIDLNFNIQKSLVYSLTSDNDLKQFYENFLSNGHALSTYFKAIYDFDIKIDSIKLVDFHHPNDDDGVDGLSVFLVENSADSCFLFKSNTILLKYESNAIKMTNYLIESILNVILRDDCIVDRFHLIDINLNEQDINERKKGCLLTGENRCGNGVIDSNEDCDCGNNTKCDNSCCDPLTCKFFKKDFDCSTGDCCFNCKLRPSGSTCRLKKNDDNECDLEEKCDGISHQCPSDAHIHDGTKCSNGACYSGKCQNADNQCKLIWNRNSVSSDESCYKNFNTIGFQNGNCAASNGSPVKYDACSIDDSICGLLNCQLGSEKPIIEAGGFFKSTTTILDKQVECKVVTNTTAKNNDLKYVNDGTVCNKDKICVNRKCVNVPHPKCPISKVNKKLCSGNGMCSSELKCICSEKWTGTACDFYLNNFNDTVVRKLDSTKSAADIEAAKLVGIIAVFIAIFMVVFGIVLNCNRRRRIRAKSTTSIDKIDRLHTNVSLNEENEFEELSLKFGSLKKSKSKPTGESAINVSMQSFGDSISLTKLNKAIKQLNTQPNKSILKKVENQEHYEEITMNGLNDTFTNTTLNAQYTTLLKRPSGLITGSSSSSSSSSTLSLTSAIPATVEINEIENVDLDEPLSEVFVDERQNSFQNKVQDYLNELNRLQKQNNLGNSCPRDVLITPVKPNIFVCESMTNTSETSSGYVSSSITSNLIQTKEKSSSIESIIYDDNETTVVEDMSCLRLNDKRHSYILATASINNLNMDPDE